MDRFLSQLTLFNIEERKLDEIQIEIFFKFVNNLKSSKKVRFIYRGTDKISEHYNTDISNIYVLSQRIFMIGAKGAVFLNDHKIEYNTFDFVWEKFNEKVCRLQFDEVGIQKNVYRFLKDNHNFTEYFSNDSNKKQFVNCNKYTEDVKKKIIDYYLALLHTIGDSENVNSYFKSSTTQYSVTQRFVNNGIILFGWVPNEKTISFEDVNKHNDFIKSLGLPTYETAMFPDEEEICLKCGLLPHFIIGFQYKDNFYINPSTLKDWNDNIINDGMDIDQGEFKNVIEKTNYKRTALFYDGNYYILQDNNKISI